MVEQEIKERVHQKIAECIQLANARFGKTFNPPIVQFTVRGTRGGYCQGVYVNFNPVLLRENVETFIATTVPHEVAHYIQRLEYPMSKSHGWEWRSIMRVFGVEPRRCHNYDVSNARVRNVRKVPAYCKCMVHHVTPRKAEQIRQFAATGHGRMYCRLCKATLTLNAPAPAVIYAPANAPAVVHNLA